MELISLSYIKSHFPLWSQYCTNPDTGEPDDNILEGERDMAQVDLLDYVDVDENSITDQLRVHLFNLVKYRLFGLKQGDTEFSTDPQIVKDYKFSRDILLKYKKGELQLNPVPTTGYNKVTIKSKKRLFNKWFNGCDDGLHDEGLL